MEAAALVDEQAPTATGAGDEKAAAAAEAPRTEKAKEATATEEGEVEVEDKGHHHHHDGDGDDGHDGGGEVVKEKGGGEEEEEEGKAGDGGGAGGGGEGGGAAGAAARAPARRGAQVAGELSFVANGAPPASRSAQGTSPIASPASAVVMRSSHAASISFLPSSYSLASPSSSSSSSSPTSPMSPTLSLRTKESARLIGTTRLHALLERGVDGTTTTSTSTSTSITGTGGGGGANARKDDQQSSGDGRVVKQQQQQQQQRPWQQQLQRAQQQLQQPMRRHSDADDGADMAHTPTRTRNQTSISSSSRGSRDATSSRASKRLSLALLGHVAGDAVLKAQDDFNLGYQASPRDARRKSTTRGVRPPVVSTVYKAIITGDERVNVRKNTADSLPLLVGEQLMLKVQNVSLLSKMDPSWPTVRVTLYATNYQLLFKKKDLEISLPLLSIRSVKKRSILQLDQDQIKLYLNDMRTFKLTFDNRHPGTQQQQQQQSRRTQIASSSREKDSDLVYSYVRSYHPVENLTQLFAFRYQITVPASLASSAIDGWSLYSPVHDFERMGLPNERWRLTKINSTYQLCETYPKILCVPRAMTKHEIVAASQFRSRNRLPVLVFVHPKTGAPLVRCSQPLVGLNGRRGPEDEKMVNLIRLSGQAAILYIIDARPKANARANRTLGGGYEAMQAYEQCQLSFMNIENIHRMRESLYALFNLLKRGEAADRKGWLTALDETQWLKHIRAILAAACRVANLLSEGHPVLTHCSDGWDRTPQLTALAQLMLDPYYRTLHGFAVLVQKEWVSFGHKFSERNGHQTAEEGARTNSSDRSPVFLQFLDCVHQMIRQFPCSFELNEYFLTFLADESYNCRFGTFLLNTEKERESRRVAEQTVSIWTYVFLHRDKFVNPFYKENRAAIYPSFSPRKVHLWEAFFLRWDSECVSKESTESVMRYAIRKIEKLNNKIRSYEQGQVPQENEDKPQAKEELADSDSDQEPNVIIGAKRAANCTTRKLSDSTTSPASSTERSTLENSDLASPFEPQETLKPTATAITVTQDQQDTDADGEDESDDETSDEDNSSTASEQESKNKSETDRSERTEAGLTVEWGMGIITSKRPRRQRALTAESGKAPLATELRPDGNLQSADGQRNISRPQQKGLPSLKQEKLSFVSNGQLTSAELNRFSILKPQSVYSPRRTRTAHRASKSDGEEDLALDDSDESARELTDSNISLMTMSNDPALQSQALKHSSTSLEERDVPPTWIPDSWARVCFHCTRPFTAINRKHHCRYCGNIFCARCSSRKIAIPKFSFHKAVRVCDPCHSRLLRAEENKRELSQTSWAASDESFFRLGLVSSASEGQQKAVKRKITQRAKLGTKLRPGAKKKPPHATSAPVIEY